MPRLPPPGSRTCGLCMQLRLNIMCLAACGGGSTCHQDLKPPCAAAPGVTAMHRFHKPMPEDTAALVGHPWQGGFKEVRALQDGPPVLARHREARGGVAVHCQSSGAPFPAGPTKNQGIAEGPLLVYPPDVGCDILRPLP